MTERCVLELQQVDATQIALVGGKAANLGELTRIEGIRVPAGFCVTTDVFRRVLADSPSIGDRLDQLSRVSADDPLAIRTLSAELRRTVERIALPDDLADAIQRAVSTLGEHTAYAVRSSATAEDLPSRVVRRPAGHLPERQRAEGDPRARDAGAGPRSTASAPSPIACATASTTARSAWP